MPSRTDNPKLVKPDDFTFEEMHVGQTWNYLKVKFGFDKKNGKQNSNSLEKK